MIKKVHLCLYKSLPLDLILNTTNKSTFENPIQILIFFFPYDSVSQSGICSFGFRSNIVDTLVVPIVDTLVVPIVDSLVVPIVDTLVVPIVDTLVVPIVDTLVVPIVDKLVVPIVDTLVVPTVDTLVVPIVDKLVVPIVDTLVVPIHSTVLIQPHLSVLQIGLPSFVSNGYRVCLSGVTRPGSQVDYSPPSKAEVKNEWHNTSAPLCAFKAWIRTTLSLPLPPHT